MVLKVIALFSPANVKILKHKMKRKDSEKSLQLVTTDLK